MAKTPVTVRNFKQVTEIFREISLSQESVKQFQIGELSDLDMENVEHTFVRFPLVFMVPRSSQMDRFGKMILGFSFIVSDIVKDNDEYLTIDVQNNCLMIMQDIMSKFIMTDWATVPLKIQTPITMIPFMERFNNNLSGWAAELNVEVQNPFDLCNAAFPVTPPTTVSVYSQVLDFISPAQYNSIVYRCDGTNVKACYGCDNQYNITDLVALFNTLPDPLPGCCTDPTFCYCWTEQGIYFDNGDGRIRCEMPIAVYNTLCPSGTLTLDVIYD